MAAQRWLRQYLNLKYHSVEEDQIFQVMGKTAEMLTDGSERTKDWWAKFLWQVAEVYRRVPDAVILNRLYGLIETPAYVRVRDGLGDSKFWGDELKLYASKFKLDKSTVKRVMPEFVDELSQKDESSQDDESSQNEEPAESIQQEQPKIPVQQIEVLSYQLKTGKALTVTVQRDNGSKEVLVLDFAKAKKAY